MMGICEVHVPSHYPLEVDVSRVSFSLACSEPVVHSWSLRRLFRPGEEWGMEAEYALEWGQTSGTLLEGVLGIFSPREETAPAVLTSMAV